MSSRPPAICTRGCFLWLCVLVTGLLGSAPVARGQSAISLEVGEVKSLTVDGVTRIVIGRPTVLDVSVISLREILLQAKAVGATNVIVWDDQGQHAWDVEVVDRGPARVEDHLRSLLETLKLPGVRIKRENGAMFLIGEVARQEDLDRLEQLLTVFPTVTNLVSLPAAPSPAEAGPLVELAVQVVELSRTDLEKLGVKWSESVQATEPQVQGISVSDALFKWGTSVTRGTSAGSLSATLNALVRKNKARILSEPKLVTTSGKEASSQIGVDVPIILATSTNSVGSTQTQVEFRKTGVLLVMTPTTRADDPDRRITIKVQAELSAIDTSVALQLTAGSVPGFTVRRAETEVTTTSGESIMIAGLLESKDSSDMDQVPALGSVPVLGRLFRNPAFQKTERELVIVLTPTLLEEKGLTAERQLALERSLAVAEVTATVEDPRLRYALQVHERILKAMRYPTDDTGLKLEGKVRLKLHLLADGSLQQVSLVESSGLSALDLEALEAARSQSPYPAFPSQMVERELWLELPVIFHPS